MLSKDNMALSCEMICPYLSYLFYVLVFVNVGEFWDKNFLAPPSAYELAISAQVLCETLMLTGTGPSKF